MQRLGPTQLTLADVAKEAGVVPATLIQRFGTKRGLLAPAVTRDEEFAFDLNAHLVLPWLRLRAACPSCSCASRS